MVPVCIRGVPCPPQVIGTTVVGGRGAPLGLGGMGAGRGVSARSAPWCFRRGAGLGGLGQGRAGGGRRHGGMVGPLCLAGGPSSPAGVRGAAGWAVRVVRGPGWWAGVGGSGLRIRLWLAGGVACGGVSLAGRSPAGSVGAAPVGAAPTDCHSS